MYVNVCTDHGLRRIAVISGCYGDVNQTHVLTPSSPRTCDDSRCSPPPAHNPPTDVRNTRCIFHYSSVVEQVRMYCNK